MEDKKPLRRKAQSAMEYLMTYGWAILIIAVVLGALFSIGVFSSTSFLGTGCVASSGYLCQNPSLIPVAGTSGSFVQLTLLLGHSTGATVYNAFFSVAPQGSSINGFGFPTTVIYSNGVTVLPYGYASGTANGITTLVSGGTTTYTFNLPITGSPWLASNSLGGTFTGSIWLNYSTVAATSQSTVAVKIGTIIAKVT